MTKNNSTYLNLEQCNHLQKDLNMDMSDATMAISTSMNGTHADDIVTFDEYHKKRNDLVPTYSLQEIILTLPRKINTDKGIYILHVGHERICYFHSAMNLQNLILVEFKENSILDNAYRMLCWSIENVEYDE